MELTAQNVHDVMRECLFKDDEMTDGLPNDPTLMIAHEGVTAIFGFHAERLENRREDIKSMLNQLPKSFRQDSGGGWSFLAACLRDDEYHWGEHKDVECLFALGCALGLSKCILGREHWHVLPGGMPYYVILVDKSE